MKKPVKKTALKLDKTVINVLCVVTIVIAISVAFVLRSEWGSKKEIVVVEKCDIPLKKLKYWPICKEMWNKNDNMRTMKRVFDRLGYLRVDGNITDWDVMWMIETPYDELDYDFTKLKHYQRVNHFPGIPYLINKKYLTTNTYSKYLPAAFEFPEMIEEFEEYVVKNPNKKFVEKNYDNRGVKIVNIKDIDYKNKNKFVQEFVENPLLIDDRMFDFGVYVVIASVNPLRVYRYQGDVLARFCPEPYYPFDPKNIDKYVVYETQKNVWQMPSLTKYCNESEYSYKTAIESYLRDQNYSVTDLWEQVDDAIVSIVQSKEHNIAKEVSLNFLLCFLKHSLNFPLCFLKPSFKKQSRKFKLTSLAILCSLL